MGWWGDRGTVGACVSWENRVALYCVVLLCVCARYFASERECAVYTFSTSLRACAKTGKTKQCAVYTFSTSLRACAKTGKTKQNKAMCRGWFLASRSRLSLSLV